MSIQPIVSSSKPVCLVGGGGIAETAILAVSDIVEAFVGVDGGADHLLAAGVTPHAVIGDMDSISETARKAFADRLCVVTEQSTTDFEKALLRVEAPAIIGLGFTGGRMDHMLSVLSVLARFPEKGVVISDDDDASFLAPKPHLGLTLPETTRISLMPLGAALTTANGLAWSFTDQLMSPDGFTSPSNRVAAQKVSIVTEGPLLVTLPRAFLPTALQAVVRAG